MNFLINVDFNDTRSLRISLVDPDPDEVSAVFLASFDEDESFGVSLFFEAPHGAEVWDVLSCALDAFKEFISSEGVV